MNTAILEHVNELRNRCIKCAISITTLMVLSFIFYDICYKTLAKPFETLHLTGSTFYIKSVLEGVLLKLKFSLFFGVIFSSPIIIFQGLRFCLPALKKKRNNLNY